jgi:hypothetical protein
MNKVCACIAFVASFTLVACGPQQPPSGITRGDVPGTYFRSNMNPEGYEILLLGSDGDVKLTFLDKTKNMSQAKTAKWIDRDRNGNIDIRGFDFYKYVLDDSGTTQTEAQLRRHGKVITLCLGPSEFDHNHKCYVKHYGIQ